MGDLRSGLERESRRFDLRPGALDRLHRRRRRRAAVQRVSAGAIATVIAAAGLWLASSAFRPGEVRSPAARVTLTADLPGRPGPVAVGFGSVWVADSQERRVSRVDPRTGRIQGEISLPGRFGTPVAIATTPDRVWVQLGVLATTPPVPPAVVAIDPRTDEIVLQHTLGSSDHAEVAVAFGSVWSANRETGSVVRRDAGTGRILARLQAPRSAVMIAAGAGSVWVLSKGAHDADPTARGTVTRIDPVRNEVSATIDVGIRPTAIAAHADAVWVVDAASRTVSRIDAASGEVVSMIPVATTPTSVAAEGAHVWVGSPDGTLSVIETSTEELVSTLHVASGVADLAAGDDGVWATAPGEGAVLRVRA